MSEFVPALTAFRESKTPKMTLEALAAEVGISVSQMSRVERFGTGSLPLALKLSRVTGLPIETFAAGNGVTA